jgi:hypothetical protein
VVKQIRANGFPIERKVRLYDQEHHQEAQQSIEIESQEMKQLLKNIAFMDSEVAKGVILSLRLYHSAIMTMYTEPEFSYLFLIMSLEAIASVVCGYYSLEESKVDGYLNSRFGNIISELSDLPEAKINRVRKKLLSNEHFTFKKVFQFVNKYCPDKFYSEEIDDAKPDRLYSVITEKGKSIKKESKKIEDLEKFDKSELKKILRNAYNARSRFVHSGDRIKAMIIVGHYNHYPVATLSEIQQAYSELVGDDINYDSYIPPLLTLERLVSYSIVNFISSEGN